MFEPPIAALVNIHPDDLKTLHHLITHGWVMSNTMRCKEIIADIVRQIDHAQKTDRSKFPDSPQTGN